jgi:two-component system cell cycle sensor histidine kinase/response regulator CckA
MHRVSASAG